MPAALIKDELVALDSRRAALAAEAVARQPVGRVLAPQMSTLYRDQLADLREALMRDHSDVEAREAIRALIGEVVLTPDNGELRID